MSQWEQGSPAWSFLLLSRQYALACDHGSNDGPPPCRSVFVRAPFCAADECVPVATRWANAVRWLEKPSVALHSEQAKEVGKSYKLLVRLMLVGVREARLHMCCQ